MDNKKEIKIILRNRVILLVLLLAIIPNLLAILTYIYIAKTVYPAMAFLVSIVLIYLVGRKSLQQRVDFNFTKDRVFIKETSYFLSDLKSYSFNETNYVGTITLNFSNRKVKLSLFRNKNKNSEYEKLKDCVLKSINMYNMQNQNRIKEFDWYSTKSAKIYGYITVFTMVLWAVLMLVYPEKLKISNLGLFLVVLAGLAPVVYKIFNRVDS